jgi:chromosome segregation ATPase
LLLGAFAIVTGVGIRAQGGTKGGSFEIDGRQQKELTDTVTSIRSLIAQLDSVYKTAQHKDSIIIRLKAEKELELITGEALLKRLKIYANMDENQRENLLKDLSSFLSKGKESIYNLGDEHLRAENKALKSENAVLKSENKTLKSEIATLKANIAKLEKLEGELKQMKIENERIGNQDKDKARLIEQLTKDLTVAKSSVKIVTEKGSVDSSEVKKLNADIEKISKDYSKLAQQDSLNRAKIDKTTKLRVSDVKFEPINVKKTKEGHYKLQQIEEFELQFKLDENYPSGESREHLKINVIVPVDDGIVQEVITREGFLGIFGQINTLKINVSSLKKGKKFGPGTFEVQVVDKDGKEIIKQAFFAKKLGWFQ